MKKLLLLLTLAPCIALGQTTAIPDTAFEQALIDKGLDTGIPDGSVLTANIDTVTSLILPAGNISDLTGIEDFGALTFLYFDNNQLTNLDLSNNLALKELYCRTNNLTSIDLSSNTTLERLSCENNQLNSLDLSNNNNLEELNFRNNQVTSIDISQITTLRSLSCDLNNLGSLDISQNYLLNDVRCNGNQLTSLDVSNHTLLEALQCDDNQLICLNIKNGNNQIIQFFRAYDNTNLTCIEVDDTTYSNAFWIGSDFTFDPQTSFSTNCNNPCSSTTGIPEPPTKPKNLLYITDILGRTTLPVPNTLLFYIYDDGSVEKRIQLER